MSEELPFDLSDLDGKAAPRLFRAIVESAPDAIVLVDDAGAIRLVNQQAEKLFGYERLELVGQPVEILLPEEHRVGHPHRRREFLASPEPRPMGLGLELSARHKSGRAIPVEISLSPVVVDGRSFVASAIRDISDRRAVVDAMKVSQKEAERANDAKTRFLAAASHDLRQPLQAAGLYLHAAVAKLGDEAPPTLPKVKACLDASGELVNKLLSLSTLQAGRVDPSVQDFPIGPLLGRLAEELRPLAEAKGLEVHAQASTEWIRSDPQILEEILRNLLSNALRYTDNGTIQLRCRSQGDSTIVAVEDTGIGIAEDKLEKIFEEFHREHRGSGEGFGLGLAIAERMARLLDHPIHVSSTLGQGSTFELRVPRSSRRGDAAAPPASLQESLVFVVDDDPVVLDALLLVIETLGCQVVGANDPETALSQLKELGRAPEAILVDYRLGVEETGLDVMRKVRAEWGREIPAALLTGDTSAATLGEVALQENFSILTKPIGPEALEEALSPWIESRRKI